MSPKDPSAVGERVDLLQSLARHRHFLRYTVRDLADEQARRAPTVSQLTLGGLIKHVAITERQWVDFILDGPAVLAPNEASWAAHAQSFTMQETETLDELLGTYLEVASRTDELVRTLPDLDGSQALPEAPWFEPGARWSARRVLLHVIAETAQHAGHADILREAIDGSKTMG